jgi:hypothetical protein
LGEEVVNARGVAKPMRVLELSFSFPNCKGNPQNDVVDYIQNTPPPSKKQKTQTHPKLANPFPHFLPQSHFFSKPISHFLT